ncbi:thiamine-phosphate synthase [bacterium BMS3Bbin08]|nr:thiamine-phosphate synthase [bacterium BMS3Bbin08]
MKNLFPRNKRLYIITDRAVSGLSHAEAAIRTLKAGARVIQLREKKLTKKEICKEALKIRKLARRYRALFIINDHVDIALAVWADGVHLGQDDMPIHEARKILGRRGIIGISTHSLKQAVEAQRLGADYIGFGPVFLTATKNAGASKGVRALQTVTERVSIPVVAIGGIAIENVPDILRAGADAAAVSSAILSGDISPETKNFLKAINRRP